MEYDWILITFVGALLVVLALVPWDTWKLLMWLGALVVAGYVLWITTILLLIRA
jgi:hypothetical protein